MADDITNTSPIGMALDLSSKTNVHRPLPAEEMDESPSPLPALLVLNNTGVVAGWWFAYAESIRIGTHYPGLALYEKEMQTRGREAVISSNENSMLSHDWDTLLQSPLFTTGLKQAPSKAKVTSEVKGD